MADSDLGAIQSVQAVGTPAYQAFGQVQAATPPVQQPARSEPAQSARKTESAGAAMERAKAEESNAEKLVKSQNENAPGRPADVGLLFRVNADTQDVTVYLLNRTTQEVIRTIPPNELFKLTPGDLINLFI
jgi:uncharacterized FlaG/YvyC family protein